MSGFPTTPADFSSGDAASARRASNLAANLAETIDLGVVALERRIGGEDSRPEGIVKLATTDAMASFLMAGRRRGAPVPRAEPGARDARDRRGRLVALRPTRDYLAWSRREPRLDLERAALTGQCTSL